MTETAAYNNARIYTDFQGLKQLQYDKNSTAAKKEVSLQFEAILMQMVLHSMRDANKSFAKDSLFGNDQMDLYQDMFDKQLSLLMSQSGSGFAAIVEKNIDQMSVPHPANPGDYPSPSMVTPEAHLSSNDDVLNKPRSVPVTLEVESTHSPETFLKKIWSSAKKAALALGTNPEILLAQAVLETNWGKSIIARGNNESSYNLFNIKADHDWKKKSITVSSLEEKNNVLVKEKSSFRGYNSFEESFMDYVDLLKQNVRYHEVLQEVKSPESFANALQRAGFATDTNYATKILNVFFSHTFQNAIMRLKEAS